MDQVRDLLYDALRARNENFWITEVFGSYLIYKDDAESKYYKLSYSILEGEVQLGSEPAEVEKTWVDAKSQQSEMDDGISVVVKMGAAKNPEGTEWEVTICEPGFTKNGWYNPDDVLQAAADEGIFENVDVNLYEFKDGGPSHLPETLFDIKKLLVKNKVGWIDGVKHVAGEGLKGVLHFVESAKWLGKNMLAAMQDGKKIYGLSYDAIVRAARDIIDSKKVFRTIKFKVADSVDIVTRPAAGGKFNRAVASMPAHSKEEGVMKKKLWDLITDKRPDLLEGKVFDDISDEDVEALARMAMEKAPEGEGKGKGKIEKRAETPAAVTKEDLDIFRCGMALEKKLAASKLPDIFQEAITEKFGGKVFETADLDAAIGKAKDAQAKMAEPAESDPIPGSGIRVGIGTPEKIRLAIDKTFGLTKDEMITFAKMETTDGIPFYEDVRSVQDVQDFDDVRPFGGLRELYTLLTGDHAVSGQFQPRNIPRELRSAMDITSTTFTYALGNTLSRRLVKVYRAYNYKEDLLISITKNVSNFKAQEAVLIGGFPKIPIVDPEAADYVEIAGVTDEEASYTVDTRGNLLTISRKTIKNDDINIVQRLVAKFGEAFRWTHAAFVWDFWASNKNCSDGTAWFTGGHGNLVATTLSIPNAYALYVALAKLTEKDSGRRLGLMSNPNLKPVLVYPVDLMSEGESCAGDDDYYTSNDLTTKAHNPLKGKVRAEGVDLLTDTTDWGIILPSELTECVEMGYMDGKKEPEFFVADTPQSEQVLVADKIRYKGRHEYDGAIIDYRSGGKSVQ